MSSKVKMERYRTQLEEARTEAAELRVYYDSFVLK
jgi:hypothetical protein